MSVGNMSVTSVTEFTFQESGKTVQWNEKLIVKWWSKKGLAKGSFVTLAAEQWEDRGAPLLGSEAHSGAAVSSHASRGRHHGRHFLLGIICLCWPASSLQQGPGGQSWKRSFQTQVQIWKGFNGLHELVWKGFFYLLASG